MLEKLYEMIDKNVLTDELKDQLQESFTSAVNSRAIEIADEMINEGKEEYTSFLNEKAEEYTELKIKEINEKVNDYLDYVVESFLKEAKDALQNDVDIERAQLLNATFNKLAESSGVNLARIVRDTSPTNENLRDSLDDLTNENIKLKKDIDNLIQDGVILEMCEGLSMVEAEKFTRLAKTLVPFSRDYKFKNSLDALKESICLSKTDEDDGEDEEINENFEDKKNYQRMLNERKLTKPSFSSSLFNKNFI